MTPTISYATAQDILDFYGAPLPYSLRGFTIRDGEGNILAIAGLMYTPDGAQFVQDIKEGSPKLTIWRVSKDIVARVRAWGIPAFATPSPDYPGAAAYLLRLGFTPGGTKYGQPIYRL